MMEATLNFTQSCLKIVQSNSNGNKSKDCHQSQKIMKIYRLTSTTVRKIQKECSSLQEKFKMLSVNTNQKFQELNLPMKTTKTYFTLYAIF
jgi:hypothetical protein